MHTKRAISKTIYTILLIALSLVPSHHLYAQGPNAPEAGAFEPVDATDMVNLVTGDFTYVLPLLNVPSPEGGYPIALSYHAGIAMDQEASWVGLGWNINPGAINRSVNGYPDDLSFINYNEFFYDEGWDEQYYSFFLEASLSDVVSVGVGLSWGSNQSLGGYVSASIGLGGENGARIGGFVGTNGVGLNGGINGFNASLSTNGVGIGYGTSKQNPGATNIGVNLNYSYNSGLSGGINLTKEFGQKNSNGTHTAVNGSLGISFDSKGINGVSINGIGAGISNSTQGVSSGDFDVRVGTNGFNLNLGFFNVGYRHQEVIISLFKYDDIYTSGILYPYSTLRSKTTNGLYNELEENQFMDVNVLQRHGFNDYMGSLIYNETNHKTLVMPNYDNYIVNAQGLSGNIRPYIHRELNLSYRGREEVNNDDNYVTYINNRTGGNTDKYFTFSSSYNSFLRLSRTNINYTSGFSLNSNNLLNALNTNSDNTYSRIGLNSNNQKREGNAIRIFTNEEVRYANVTPSNYLNGFIEARNLNRQDKTVFLDKSIGAYQITTPDGRTYHYSLPVYQFDSVYKNFRNEEYNSSGEFENFYEIQKRTPYATHWLLTAITGPDYIDVNNNKRTDEGDYGYWVELHYGKWSDGYVWETPIGRTKEVIDADDPDKKTNSYSWGIKQVYYLDAIKTRTHTALFVKDLRQDNISNTGDKKDVNLTSHKRAKLNKYKQYYTRYVNNGSYAYKPYKISFCNSPAYPGSNVRGDEGIFRDVSNTTHKLLKLNKIILLKNDKVDLTNLNATGTGLVNQNQLTVQSSVFYDNLVFNGPGGLTSYYFWGGSGIHCKGEGVNILYKNNPTIKSYNIHQHQNVIDVTDINGLNLEGSAQQIVELDHDYTLAKNVPNSNASTRGRLTLNKVNFKGKANAQIVPPYRFSYLNTSILFDEDKIDDWGFHKDVPHAWSLNRIYTPIGSQIKIEHEADSYMAEAATYETLVFDNVTMTSPTIKVEIEFSDDTNLNNYFEVGRKVELSFKRSKLAFYKNLPIWSNKEEFKTLLRIASIDGNTLKLYRLRDITEGLPAPPNYFTTQCSNLSGGYCFTDVKIKNNKVPLYTDSNSNGKEGGGIRTKKITVSNGTSDIASTEYNYNNPLTNKISGITPYAPSKIQKGIPYSSELPSPMVMYSHVTMINKDGRNNYLGKTEYEFETLKPEKPEAGYLFSLGDAFKIKENQNTEFGSGGQVKTNKFSVENRLGNLGRIKIIESYNSENQLLSKVLNNYKQNLDADGEIGVNQESFKSYKVVRKDGDLDYYVNSTSKITYPSVLENITMIDGSYINTTHFNKYDFLTGQALEVINTNSKGTRFKTETIPAYTLSAYGTGPYSMGSKVDHSTNKNMLVQNAMTKTYLESGGKWKEIGVGITTWNNDWEYTNIDGTSGATIIPAKQKVWRKHKTFVWDGTLNYDGTLLGFSGEDDNFQWGINAAQTNPKWKNVSTISMYDHYSKPLEVRDINNNYATTKMTDGDSKVSFVCNARYGESFYTGAESKLVGPYLDQQIKMRNNTTVSNTYAHTGTKSIKIPNGSYLNIEVKDGYHKAGKYKVSVWVKKGMENNARVGYNGAPSSFTGEKVYAGDWVQLNHYVTLNGGSSYVYITTASGTIYVDDVRVHPVSSSMTSYVYNEWDELSHIIGNNGLATQYEYDSAGRLAKTYTEVADFEGAGSGGFKISSEHTHNYKK